MTRASNELRQARQLRPEGANLASPGLAHAATEGFASLQSPGDDDDVLLLRQKIQELRSIDHPLSDSQIDSLWRASGVAGIVRKMDGMDAWAVDKVVVLGIPMSPEVELRVLRTMKVLAEALYSDEENEVSKLYSHRVDVAHFLCHLRSSRALAAFRAIIERAPRVAISLMSEAGGQEPESSVFVTNLYERLRVMERTRVLSRVFSPSRVAEILEIMDIKSGNLIE